MIYRFILSNGHEDFDSLKALMLKYPNAVEAARVENIYYFE